jgi:hypothetical protein
MFEKSSLSPRDQIKKENVNCFSGDTFGEIFDSEILDFLVNIKLYDGTICVELRKYA